ncbi:MAG: DUF1015 domain-containing protein [Deltaproteobacteria bacterium]|nr:DUF1015 domain-containing protein [Deltaproteobacteria bacterium]
MSIIKPFKGIRPEKSNASNIASLPYDVLNSNEARILAQNNPMSFLHVVKPEIDLPKETDIYADEVYLKGKENFNHLLEKGLLFKDTTDSLYIYRQIMPVNGKNHIQTGLVAGASTIEYENSLIKKHEFTRVVKERDRTRHIDTLNVSTGPVFLTYKASDKINSLIKTLTQNTPEYDFTSADGISHIFWVVKDSSDITLLCEAFKEVPCMYIADGHHRSASACTVSKMRREANPDNKGDEPYNYFLSVMFPHDELMILDYNRVVKDLNNHTPEELIEKIKEKFTVEHTDSPKPDQKHTFGMFLDNKWYRLTAKEGTFDDSDPVKQLDVSILQENLLAPLLGIGDPRTDERIDFIGGIRGMAELEKRVNEDCKVAFSMFATPIEQLMAIADADKVMPPKSTWFEPKLRSGLISKSFSE